MGMSGGGKGGGGSQTTTTNPNPWSGSEPYLREGLHNLQQVYETGHPTGPATVNGTTYAGTVAAPEYYPGSTVAPMSPWTQGALGMQAARGVMGSPLTQAAQGELTRTMHGDYLGAGNPYMQGAMNAAIDPVRANVDSVFSQAGRYGSGAHTDQLAQGIGDITSRMAYQNYGDERNRQQQGMMWAPELAKQDYVDINQLGTSGSAIDAYNQAQIQADLERYNYGQDADWQRTAQFLQTVQGSAPFGSSSSTSMPKPDAFQSILGTGMGLAGIGKMFGLFSDARLKEDIERVGILHNGLPIYSFRYTGDPTTQIGLMAQDVEQVKPEAVGEIGGFKTVRYDLATAED